MVLIFHNISIQTYLQTIEEETYIQIERPNKEYGVVYVLWTKVVIPEMK